MSPEAIYCFDRASVLLAIYPDGRSGPRVVAEITEDALRDVFAAQDGAEGLVQACLDHFGAIERIAKEHYRRKPTSPVELSTSDFSSTTVAGPEWEGAPVKPTQ